jgi:hypothetical protein
MNHIAVLPEEKVPRDAEFKFRDRAKALVDKWRQLLNANKPNGAEAATNGAIKVKKMTREWRLKRQHRKARWSRGKSK